MTDSIGSADTPVASVAAHIARMVDRLSRLRLVACAGGLDAAVRVFASGDTLAKSAEAE